MIPPALQVAPRTSDTGEMAPEPMSHRTRTLRRPLRALGIIFAFALAASLAAISATASPVEAQQNQPTVDDTARLLGYLWADGSYSNGVWDATGPSGGSEIIQHLVILHGGSWVDRPQLKFTLPAPYDWVEWKGSLPNDDARTRQAVRRPNFLAALLEGEGSTAGLVYDQSSCCTAGFTGGRLTELRALLVERGFSTATLTMFADADSGRVDIRASEFAELRAGHQFVCPASGAAIRVPGAEDFGSHGPIKWFQAASPYGDVVRTDCPIGQAITSSGPPVGGCIVTSDGNGQLRLTWTHKRGTVVIRRNGTFLSAVSSLDKVFVDAPSTGAHNYTVRVTADGLRSDHQCGTANTTDAFTPPPVPGQTCMGEVITVLGTGRSETINGTAGADVIHGFGGDDSIYGVQGNDKICGGSGDDTIYAGKGNDIAWGGQGFDVLFGAQGDDVLRAVGSTEVDSVGGSRMFGGIGNDTIEGSSRWDRMQGGPGNDVLRGYSGRDWMRGGSGNDLIIGSAGIDDLHGGNGADFLQIQGSDTIRGGAGRDGCVYDTPSPAVVISCEVRLTQATSPAFINSIR